MKADMCENEKIQDEPIIVPAKVREVTKKEEDEKIVLLTPLIPLNHPCTTHFLATICYDLHKYGVSWRKIREWYHLPQGWTAEKVKNYIMANGRMIKSEESVKNPFYGFKGEVKALGVKND